MFEEVEYSYYELENTLGFVMEHVAGDEFTSAYIDVVENNVKLGVNGVRSSLQSTMAEYGDYPIEIFNEQPAMTETSTELYGGTPLNGYTLGGCGSFQGEDGRWYQVVNKVKEKGNWPENSCSSLFAAAIAKAVRYGVLPESCAENAWKAFRGVSGSLAINGDDLEVGNVCIGTGVGDYDFYINRPCSINDLHGVGAFLLMCASMEELRRWENER